MLTDDIQGSLSTFYYSENVTYIHVETEFQPDVCFTTSRPSCDVTEMADCSTIPPYLDYIKMRFIHTDRTKTIVFGDIKVKAIMKDQSRCSVLDLDESGYLYDGLNDKVAQIQYFHAAESVNDTFTYYPLNDTDGWKYYMAGEELDYVQDVWLTGYRKCEMTGSVRPNLDLNLELTC